MTRLPLAVVTALTALAAAAPAGAAPSRQERPLRDVDVRQADGGPLPASQRRGRAALEDALGDEGVVSTDRISGGARLVARTDGFLTGRRAGPPTDVALDYVRARPAVFGLDAADLDALRINSRYRSSDGVTHLAYAQTYQRVGAYDNVLLANVDGDGRLLNVGGAAISDLRVASVVPDLDAGAALAAATRAVGGALVPPRARQAPSGPERATRFSNGDRAQLTIFSDGRADRLAWKVVLTGKHGFLYEAVVDAASGELLKRRSLTEFDDARVYDLYPGAAGAGGIARTVDLAPWLTSTTTLSGNNARAYADVGPVDGPATIAEIAPNPVSPRNWVFPQVPVPTGLSCPAAGCTWDPSIPTTRTVNRSQATTQLFYLVNRYHDHLAAAPIGFTHAARGFEVIDADGPGPGIGGDPVLAETDNLDEDVSPPNTDNSSMSTPPDGQSPKLQVLFFTNPSLNAADAADIVYHEYTHGLTNRSIGTGIGLTADQSRAMGEGWSDWYALDFLATQNLIADTAAPDEMKIGTYLQAGGFRRQGADCPVGSTCPGTPGTGSGGFTFGDLGRFSAGFSVHDNGEIWLETLWDIRNALGSATAEELITSGLRLTPNNPDFLEARDGIIQADRVLGGAHYTTLWQLFAARGMGYGAATSSADGTSATEAFDMPPPLRHESTAVTDPAPGGDGDGIAEPGETVRLVESLRNMAPFGVTGVSGVLRGTTPGVVAVQPSSTWPSFAADAVQAADSAFSVAIPSSLPCGRRAQMSLRVATAQGNATIPLDISTGELGPTASSSDVPRAIATSGADTISTLTFPPSGATVHDLKVRIAHLAHSFVGDLRISLEAPGGTTVMLMNRPGAGDFGASGDDFADLVLDDDAVTPIDNLPDINPPGGFTGSYRPSERLATFDGTSLQGTWKLRVSDNFADADSGRLDGWGLIPAGRQCSVPANGEPVGAADAFSVTAGSTLSGSSVLANDGDPDGSPLTAIELSEPAHGVLSLAPDGRFTYTPAGGFSGADSFTYVAYDGRATSAPTTVSIAVGAASGPASAASSAPPPPPPPRAARAPAKLQVLRAGVSGGRLDILAAITAKATGKVRVTYRSAGATTALDAAASGGRIRFRRTVPRSRRSKPTGIVTLAYAGSALVEPDSVALRAARGRAKLVRTSSRIDAGGRLRVAGTITPRARGVVRVRLGYAVPGGDSKFLDYQAKIARGRWSLSTPLPPEAAAAGGQLSIQFTGYEPLAIRGEQIAKAVAAAR